MKKLFFLGIFIFQITIAVSSQPSLMWSQAYNGPPDNADEAVSIAVDAFGNSYVTGSAFASNGTLDMVTIKYDINGNQLWLHNYNGSANVNDQATKLILDNAGNVYITGYSNNANSQQDITTIKYNTNGVLQWVQLYDGAFGGSDGGISLSLDAAGNLFVTGYETTAGYATDFVTLKYNTAGNLQWFQTYNGPGNSNDDAKDIGIDANGNIYVTGTSDTVVNSSPNENIILIKYNNAGIFQWRKVYDSPGHGFEFSKKLAIDRNSNVIVEGYTFVTNDGFDYFTFKWDSSGNFQWMRNYNYAANTFETPNAIIIDSLNNIIITGQGIAPNSGSTNDYVTVKYDAAGNFLWASRYNNIYHGEDRGEAIALDDSLNIYVTGFSKSTSDGFDIATIKYDPAGNELYVLRYNNANANRDDAGNAIAIHNGDIYVTGRSANLTNDDYITLRYSYGTPLAVNENAVENYSQIFPNPAHEELNVALPENNLTTEKNYHAEIINAFGQKIMMTTSSLPVEIDGKEVLTINTSELPAGIYFLMVYSGSETIGISKFVKE